MTANNTHSLDLTVDRTSTSFEDSLSPSEHAHRRHDSTHPQRSALGLPLTVPGVNTLDTAAHTPISMANGPSSPIITEDSAPTSLTARGTIQGEPAGAEIELAEIHGDFIALESLLSGSQDDPVATETQLVEILSTFPFTAVNSGTTLKRGNAKDYGRLISNLIEFGVYKTLAVLTLFVNLVVLVAAIIVSRTTITYTSAGTAASINLAVAVLMRQEHYINLVFHLACAIPLSAPFWLRSLVARFPPNNGGIHVGAALSAFSWYILYMVLLFMQFEGTTAEIKATRTLSVLIAVDFLVLISLSGAKFRQKHHDIWEMSHRLGGWMAVVLFWAQTMLTAVALAHAEHLAIGSVVIRSPDFWCIIFITCCLIYPWTRLRRVKIRAEKLSDKATRLWFRDVTPPLCRGIRISMTPFGDYHGFATIANAADDEPGFSIIVSALGDFTGPLVQTPPTHVWVRGAKAIGVVRLASLFRRVVILGTGSGIGPCMSFFQPMPGHPMRILWSASDPRQTLPDILASVLSADPRALVVDTARTGRPDTVALLWSMVQEFDAEAVFVVSNPKLTSQVMDQLQERGVLVLGPIFDS